jgi:hypothetical protein
VNWAGHFERSSSSARLFKDRRSQNRQLQTIPRSQSLVNVAIRVPIGTPRALLWTLRLGHFLWPYPTVLSRPARWVLISVHGRNRPSHSTQFPIPTAHRGDRFQNLNSAHEGGHRPVRLHSRPIPRPSSTTAVPIDLAIGGSARFVRPLPAPWRFASSMPKDAPFAECTDRAPMPS